MKRTKIKNIYFLRILRRIFVLIGIFFVFCVLLALTEQPFWGYYWLGTSKSEMKWKPETIVFLGGGGMPSQSNLMRCWYTEKAARSFPDAQIIIAVPGDIVDSFEGPGVGNVHNEIRWELTNISSGVYLCRIEANSATENNVRIIKIMVVN